MSILRFLQYLNRLRLKWEVNSRNQIRTTVDGIRMCPITAVYYSKNKKKIKSGEKRICSTGDVYWAVKSLGLDANSADKIIHGADNKSSIERFLIEKVCGITKRK